MSAFVWSAHKLSLSLSKRSNTQKENETRFGEKYLAEEIVSI